MANPNETVVVIVPTYNEKGNIERLVDILATSIFPKIPDRYSMKILVVDDSSPDGTGTIVHHLTKRYHNLYLLSNQAKLGLGNAYMKGMRYAISRLKAQIVFEFDADLSHDPEKIPLMLRTLTKGYDMVLGSRYIPGGSIPKKWGWHRKFLSIVGNMTIRVVVTDLSIHDWTTGYRAIRTEVIEAVLPELDQDTFMGYTFQIGMLLKARRKGFRVAEIPFHFKDRTLGKSKIGSEYIKNTLSYLLKVRMQEIVGSRVFKFVVVGGIGAMVQLTMLQVFRTWLPYQLAYFFSVELAVASNFVLSNRWTFSDRKLRLRHIPYKFIQFNLASFGSILIQQSLAFVGEKYIGLYPVFTMPIVGFTVDTGLLFAVTGILLGMIWNFMAYSRIVWRKK